MCFAEMVAWQPPGAGSRPVSIGSRFIGVSLQPAIPRRVAPQQSLLPLHQSPTILAQSQSAEAIKCAAQLPQGCSSGRRPAFGCGARARRVRRQLGVSSLLCAPGDISILRRHRITDRGTSKYSDSRSPSEHEQSGNGQRGDKSDRLILCEHNPFFGAVSERKIPGYCFPVTARTGFADYATTAFLDLLPAEFGKAGYHSVHLCDRSGLTCGESEPAAHGWFEIGITISRHCAGKWADSAVAFGESRSHHGEEALDRGGTAWQLRTDLFRTQMLVRRQAEPSLVCESNDRLRNLTRLFWPPLSPRPSPPGAWCKPHPSRDRRRADDGERRLDCALPNRRGAVPIGEARPADRFRWRDREAVAGIIAVDSGLLEQKPSLAVSHRTAPQQATSIRTAAGAVGCQHFGDGVAGIAR